MPEHQMRTALILSLVTPAIQSSIEFSDEQALLMVKNADTIARAMMAHGTTFDDARKGIH